MINKKVLHEVIGDVCRRSGDREAIREPGGSIGYRDLEGWYGRIGRCLRQEGLVRGEAVGVYLESGIDYVAVILGVNRAGGVFMPLEVQYPVRRLGHILEIVRPRQIVTRYELREELLSKLSGLADHSWLQHLLYVDRKNGQVRKEALPDEQVHEGELTIVEATAAEGEVEVSGEDSNYLLYTSGSTGSPKVIEGMHKSLSHFIHWEVEEFGLDSGVRVGQLVPLSFDVSLRDIFVPLLSGGVLVIPDSSVRKGGFRLLDWLQSESVTLLHTVPSIFRLLLREMRERGERLPKLRQVILAGEALYGRDVIDWRNQNGPDTELVNIYGPTETTLAKIFNRIGPEAGDPNSIIPLGVPISNTHILIIRDNRLCDVGVIGEIYIKTPFMTKGYYRDATMTAERFVQNPLHADYTDIVYRTGDYGRYLKDRSIGFAGRQDSQLKIRGNRVELPEVETVLLGMPGMEQVVVTAQRDAEGSDVLCCYYRGEQKVIEEFREFLRERLPDYMHPSYYLRLEELPLALNGKIDRRSLPAPQELLERQYKYVAPQTPVQESLCRICADILGLARVGIATSFFELGGHSLTATKVVSRIYSEMGMEVSLKDFFDHPRIAELSVLLESRSARGYEPIRRVKDAEDYPLSPAQKLLWILDGSSGGMIAYNMPLSCMFGPGLSAECLSRSLQRLSDRHESLRTVFRVVEGQPRQHILPKMPIVLEVEETDVPPEREEDFIHNCLGAEFRRRFDLERGPLLRARLVRLPSKRYLFLCTMHHIVSDGWSMGVMMRDLLAFYESEQTGRPVGLRPLEIQYRDYVTWQEEQLKGERVHRASKYWREKLGGERPLLELPLDYPRPKQRTYAGNSLYLSLGKERSHALRNYCQQKNCSLFMLFFALVNLVLYKKSGQNDMTLGSAVTGRNQLELEDQIGFFVNLFTIRSRIDRKETFSNYLARIRQLILEAYEYQMPFEQLVADLGLEHKAGRHQWIEVLVVLNNAGMLGSAAQMEKVREIWDLEELRVEEGTSKFDLTFFINDAEEILITLEYSTELFMESTIDRMREDIERLTTWLTGTSVGPTINELVWRLTGHTESRAVEEKVQLINEDF
jgi:amino acid adenylation domain-containing protein